MAINEPRDDIPDNGPTEGGSATPGSYGKPAPNGKKWWIAAAFVAVLALAYVAGKHL